MTTTANPKQMLAFWEEERNSAALYMALATIEQDGNLAIDLRQVGGDRRAARRKLGDPSTGKRRRPAALHPVMAHPHLDLGGAALWHTERVANLIRDRR